MQRKLRPIDYCLVLRRLALREISPTSGDFSSDCSTPVHVAARLAAVLSPFPTAHPRPVTASREPRLQPEGLRPSSRVRAQPGPVPLAFWPSPSLAARDPFLGQASSRWRSASRRFLSFSKSAAAFRASPSLIFRAARFAGFA